MLQITTKNVFNMNAKCIVNPINTQGVMGAGLALDFRLKYPNMFAEYRTNCQQQQITIGKTYLYQDPYIQIINFPTKIYWAQQSQIEWIEQGLNHFLEHYQSWGISSIAFPMLGAGLGGLDSKKVEALMIEKFKDITDIETFLCQDLDPAQGIELEMLSALFEIEPELKNHINRFRDLQKIKNKVEYECLFLKAYKNTNEYLMRKNLLSIE